MMPTLLDDLTVEAVHILADAVRRERVPGIVEFGVLDRALTAVAVEPTRENLTVADGVFDTLDPSLQQQIADRAIVLAKDMVAERHAPVTFEPLVHGAKTSQCDMPEIKPERPKSGLTPFLSAVNHVRIPLRAKNTETTSPDARPTVRR